MIRVTGFFQQKDLHVHPKDRDHLLRSLRVKLHESIEVLVDGLVYPAQVTQLDPLTLTYQEPLNVRVELPVHLTLLYVLPKGEKLDLVIEKAVELGVSEVIAIHSQHSVVRWQEDQLASKFQKYEKKIHESTLQSKRTAFMTFQRYMSFDDALKLPFDMRLIASEIHRDDLQAKLPIQKIKNSRRIAILVGAEGGFSSEEVQKALQVGYQPVSLGSRILRTETAAIVAMSHVSYWSEQQ
jgi:16S rRNA (uracil1498-N3)-methyltransferase